MAAPTQESMTAEENALEKADCQPAEPKIKVHNFSDKVLDSTVHFQVLKLEDSFLLWVGSTPNMENLAMAMATKFVSVCGG